MSDWKEMISEADRAILEKGSWGRRAGFGVRPALIVIDAQNYMVGRPGDHDDYPLSCGDVVIDKKKPSCFFGTPLQAYLNDRRVDTLIITGGSTANCVRATAVESSSFNYFTILPREAVFDRIPLSHEVSLFDLDRGFADVVTTAEVVDYLARLPRRNDPSEPFRG